MMVLIMIIGELHHLIHSDRDEVMWVQPLDKRYLEGVCYGQALGQFFRVVLGVYHLKVGLACNGNHITRLSPVALKVLMRIR